METESYTTINKSPEAKHYTQLLKAADALYQVGDYEAFEIAELTAANYGLEHEKEIWNVR